MAEYRYRDTPFCQRLRGLIFSANEVQGLSDGQIAADIGIPNANLSKYKLGVALPSAQRLIKLADYFGVSTDYLLGREGYELEEER